jgi:S1-C subfamily serine protease
MSKTKCVLLLILAVVSAVYVRAQSAANVTFKVALVDKDLNLKPVPKFALTVRKDGDSASQLQQVSTSFNGSAELQLSAGKYVVSSAKPVDFVNQSFSWEVKFVVEAGKAANVDLSNDNAKVVGYSTSDSNAPRRRVSQEGELFKTLRDGVVTVEGELGSGTGFIFDDKGLVLTNQHVIAGTNDIRVRFDKNTAVRARLLAVDEERDIAVLQVNLAAFPKSRLLKFAAVSGSEPPLVEGEHVFTIGSPLHQEKILTSGIVSKIEARAIISDINVNAGNSGGPLFNSLGEVVGLTTFQVTDKDEKGPGIAGIVRIEEATELIAKARELAASKGLPSAELMPNAPEGTFPVETIKAALSRKDFPIKEYIVDVKDYEIKYMTPVYKFYEINRDRMESLKNREKRNSKNGAVDAADKFKDLHYWSEYAGELRPTVDILALPETTATGKSMFLSIATSATTGIATPLDYKYKADFYQMKLMCDGQEVTPISRNKIELNRQLQHYYKTRTRYTFAGVYSYHYDIFAPGRCQKMEVQVFSEEDIETPITTTVDSVRKSRVWADFEDFRKQVASRP